MRRCRRCSAAIPRRPLPPRRSIGAAIIAAACRALRPAGERCGATIAGRAPAERFPACRARARREPAHRRPFQAGALCPRRMHVVRAWAERRPCSIYARSAGWGTICYPPYLPAEPPLAPAPRPDRIETGRVTRTLLGQKGEPWWLGAVRYGRKAARRRCRTRAGVPYGRARARAQVDSMAHACSRSLAHDWCAVKGEGMLGVVPRRGIGSRMAFAYVS